MIKMNPKFKSKVKEEIKILDGQLGLFAPAQSPAAFNPVSTTVLKIIMNVITNNKGLLKLTPNIYMNDDVIYYINEEKKEYYSITKIEYTSRLEYMLCVSILEIGLKLFPISYLDQEFTKKIQEHNFSKSKLEKSKVIAIKNDLWTQLRIDIKHIFYKYMTSQERQNMTENTFQDLVANLTEIILRNNDQYLKLVDDEDTQSSTDIGGLFYIFTYRYIAHYILMLMYIYVSIGSDAYNFNKDRLIALYFQLTMSPQCLSIIDKYVEYEESNYEGFDDIFVVNFDQKIEITIKRLLDKSQDSIEWFQRVFSDAQHYMNCEFNARKHLNNHDISHILQIQLFDSVLVSKSETENDYDIRAAFYTYYMYAPEYETVLPMSNNPLYEEEIYSKFISSNLKHDIFCSFLSDKWKDSYFDKMNRMAKSNLSKKDIDLLVKSFKHIAFLVPSTYSLSSNVFLTYLADFSVVVLDPEISEDEELFNKFFFDVQKFYPSKECFNLAYNEHYSAFHSKDGLYVFINRGGARYLINLYDEQGALSQPLTATGIANPTDGFDDIRKLISFASMSGNYYNDILNINNDNYKSNYAQKHQVGEIVYFIFSLIEYLKQKQKDGSIELKMIETEEIYDRKRKTTTFKVHERKSSWVRAHYRHYKSGLVTLVTAHSRKGTNVSNERLVLNL